MNVSETINWFARLACRMNGKHVWKYPKGEPFKVCRRCKLTLVIKRRMKFRVLDLTKGEME